MQASVNESGGAIVLLRNRVVFLTGGASGIGRECASAYVREGASVAIADIDPEQAVKTASNLGGTTLALTCDVSDSLSVGRAITTTLEHFGRLDAVHNNAGVPGPPLPLQETTDMDWDQVFSVNLKSILLTTRAALPSLKSAKGTILNTASMVGLIGQANHAAYAASKGAMITLTKCMALDYAPLGIRVNAISPAGVWTPMLERWASGQQDPEGIRKYLDDIHALGYCPRGDVIADAAVFLLSDHARFITGCILPVSGGAEIGYRR
jgi:meso-butanediol dehydrogenase / (S,S)-butanediol dehydrogenase / diacetyl reductase